MKIRPMQLEDIPACARLMASLPLWQRYNVSESSAGQRFEDGYLRSRTILVAEVEDQVAGFLWYEPQGAFSRSGYVMLIGVAPEQHGQGIGRALMAQAEAAMFADCNDVFLLVSDFNTQAQRFYRNLGYQQIGRIPDYILPGVTELIFHKTKKAFFQLNYSG